MEPIVTFLNWMQLVKLALLGLTVMVGVVVLLIGLFKKKRWLIGLGLFIGIAPVAFPALSNLRQQDRVADRRAAVAGMKFHPLSADYPKQMIVRGDLFDQDSAELLIRGYVDELHVVDSNGSRWFSQPDRSPECVVAIKNWARSSVKLYFQLDPLPLAEANTLPAKIQNCAARSRAPFAIKPRHLLVRLDNKVTQRVRDRLSAPTAIQIDLIDGNRTLLAHYDEMPVLAYPSSATHLLPPGFDYPCSDFDTVQVIVNTLDSAQTPKNRAQLMQRIGRIGECVTTPLAVKAEDEEAARRQLQKDQINWLRANPPWYLRD